MNSCSKAMKAACLLMAVISSRHWSATWLGLAMDGHTASVGTCPVHQPGRTMQYWSAACRTGCIVLVNAFLQSRPPTNNSGIGHGPRRRRIKLPRPQITFPHTTARAHAHWRETKNADRSRVPAADHDDVTEHLCHCGQVKCPLFTDGFRFTTFENITAAKK